MDATDDKSPVYSVVIPTYNPGEAIRELVIRLIAVFDSTGKTHEIIIIDDASPKPECQALLNDLIQLENVSIIFLNKNFGKAGAVMCGFNHASGDWIITIDDDLQQSPEDIHKLLDFQDHDVVIAHFPRKKHTFSQRLTSCIKHQFDKRLLGYSTPISPLKLIKRHVVETMVRISTNRPFIPALIKLATDDVVGIKLEHHASAYKKSRFSFHRRIRHFCNLIIGNSSFLMKVFLMLGSFFAISGVLLLIGSLLNLTNPCTGTFLISSLIMLMGGLNLVAVGLTGEYFIRILDNTSMKPSFVVRRIAGNLQKIKER